MQTERPFTVVRYEDLNSYPELRLPVEFEEIKTFCCLFCKSEPLMVKVRIPKTGFALGEKIPVRVEMINKSSTDVSHTTFTLKRVETFNSVSPREKQRIVKEEVTEARSLGVKGGETVNLEELIEIPQILMISNNRYCNVFQITYELKFTAETVGMSVSPDVHIPITIGSVGLTDGFQPTLVQPSAPQDFRKTFLPNAVNQNLLLLFLAPTFEQATMNSIK